MNKYEENVYKNLFEYPTKKIIELEFKNEQLENENQLLKKQKADVVEYIKNNAEEYKWEDDDGAINKDYCCEGTIILRMLGEIDE